MEKTILLGNIVALIASIFMVISGILKEKKKCYGHKQFKYSY